MAYCRECGNKHPDTAKFCPNCGEEIAMSTGGAYSKNTEASREKTPGSQGAAPLTNEVEPQVINYETNDETDENQIWGCIQIIFRMAVLAIVVVLLFTNPNESDFSEYIYEGDTSMSGLIEMFVDIDVERKNFLLFSTFKYEASFIGIAEQEKYIGIFNRFIQLGE